MEITGLIPTFGNFAWTVVAFIAALSIIVAVHEYGHYIVGRWSGIHAEVFSLGFGPVIFARKDRHGTRWQLAALPFGGFVKFLGDANAASGKDGAAISLLSPEERRHTMHGAPLWARAATVAAGPIFNFILSVAVFAGFFLFYGVATELPVVGALKPTPYAGQSLLPGDRILAVNGAETPDLEAFVGVAGTLPPAGAAEYRVLRDGAEVVVQGPFPFPPVVDGVQPQSAAMDAGIRAGDVVLTVDGTPVNAFGEMPALVEASGGKPVLLTVWRGGESYEVALVPNRRDLPRAEGGFETRWLIGLSGGLVFEPETRTPGPIEIMTLGASRTWNVAVTNLSFLWNIVIGNVSSCNVSGPIGIAKVSGAAATQGPETFILLIAMLSTSVGLLNLFPIPILDGGHLVFHAWEAVTGKPPSDGALRVLMTTGLLALLALMAFALTNDLFCP